MHSPTAENTGKKSAFIKYIHLTTPHASLMCCMCPAVERNIKINMFKKQPTGFNEQLQRDGHLGTLPHAIVLALSSAEEKRLTIFA